MSRGKELPRPDIQSSTGSFDDGTTVHTDVVVSRDGKGKSYRGEGSSEAARTRDVVKKILEDPHTAEWLP